MASTPGGRKPGGRFSVGTRLLVFRQSGEAVAAWGLALIIAATLFPFDFAVDDEVSISDGLAIHPALKPRGTDLIIGADAAFEQVLRGKISQLRIYGDALTPVEIANEAA